MAQDIDLDLGAIEIPVARVRMPLTEIQKEAIKLGDTSIVGDIVEVHPPSLQSLLRLGSMMKLWQKQRTEKESDDTLEALQDFVNKIESIIPGVKGYDLSIDALMKVVTLSMSLAEPAHLKELERHGITIDNTGKKKSS